MSVPGLDLSLEKSLDYVTARTVFSALVPVRVHLCTASALHVLPTSAIAVHCDLWAGA